MQSDCSGKPEGRSRKNNDMRKFRDWACKGRQESTIGRGGCTGQHIPEPTALKTLKSNGSMTVSKRGNTEREKRRKPPQPHSKTKQPTAKRDFPITGNPFFTPKERSDLLTEKNKTPAPPRKPDGIITTQRNGQTIVAELFFNHSGTETFRDKLLKMILADRQE